MAALENMAPEPVARRSPFRSPQGLVRGATVLSVLLVVGLVALFVWRDRQDVQGDAERLAANMAAILGEHAEHLFESADVVLAAAARMAGPEDQPPVGTRETHEQLKSLAARTDYVTAIWIRDAAGYAVASSRAFPTPKVGASDRASIPRIREGSDGLHIERLASSRPVGSDLISVTRRLSTPGGDSRGFVQVGISPTFFSDFYASLPQELDAEFWLLDDGMRPLAHEPPVLLTEAASASIARAFAPFARDGAGTLELSGPLGGQPRLYAFRRVSEAGVVVVAGLGQAAATASWHRRVVDYLVLGAAAVVAISGFGAFASKRIRDDQVLTRRLDSRVRERTLALEAAVAQKDLLLREVNHRVKNSLQLVSSLLALQRLRLGVPDADRALEQAGLRVMTVARVHERLYRSNDVASVPLDSYLGDLCADLEDRANARTIRLRADPIALPTDRVVPLALIVTELVTNAFKYAYPEGQGKVEVVLEATEGGGCRLTVRDRGIGLPPGIRPGSGGGLGMELVGALARQLGADVAVFDARPGARIVIDVPPA